VAAGTTYVPVQVFYAYLEIPWPEQQDTARSTLVELALASASRMVDKDTGRRFWLDEAPVARELDTAGRVLADEGRLLVPDIGSVDGLVVEVGGGGTWSAVDAAAISYAPRNALAVGDAYTGLVWAGGWPGGVRITARWGWPAVPAEIAQATLIRAAALFKRQASIEGVVSNPEWGPVRVARNDPDYAALISRYVRHSFA
jgi:hypothetical protein